MKNYLGSNNRRALAIFLVALLALPVSLLFAQGTPPLAKPGKYSGRNITGDLVRDPSVNIAELASAPTSAASSAGAEIHPNQRPVLRPPVRDSGAVLDRAPAAPQAAAAGAPTPSFRGFTGLLISSKELPETVISFLPSHRIRDWQSGMVSSWRQ